MKPPTVVVVGPFPPPVHGMAKSNAGVAGALRRRCDVVVSDTSPGSLERRLAYHAVKTVKVFRSLFAIIAHASRRDARLYVSADAGLGTWYTIAAVTLARLLGYKVFIHHHSFAYIRQRTARMAALARCAGSGAVHIFLCPEMKRRFRDRYPRSGNALILSNAAHVEPVARVAEPRFGGLRLGHLGNLQSEKGLDVVLETTRRLRARDVNCRLVLAGPAPRAEEARMIEAAAAEFGEALDYRGPVYGEQKRRFYGDIDVFLLPTRSDAQPLVVLEAMAFGVPSISFARGCLAGDLSRGGGVAVPASDDFVEACLPVLLGWERNRDRLVSARNKARSRALELRSAAKAELARFVDTVAGARTA